MVQRRRNGGSLFLGKAREIFCRQPMNCVQRVYKCLKTLPIRLPFLLLKLLLLLLKLFLLLIKLFLLLLKLFLLLIKLFLLLRWPKTMRMMVLLLLLLNLMLTALLWSCREVMAGCVGWTCVHATPTNCGVSSSTKESVVVTSVKV